MHRYFTLSSSAVSGRSFKSGQNEYGEWIEFPDGTIIQWGITNSNYVTFPKTFTTTPKVVSQLIGYSGASPFSLLRVQIHNITLVGFYFGLIDGYSGPGEWIAIGR